MIVLGVPEKRDPKWRLNPSVSTKKSQQADSAEPNPTHGGRLCVFMPALNEEATIARVIAGIPQFIPGIARVDVLVVDDGSTDRTREVAEAAGAFVISLSENHGVGHAFQIGVDWALKNHADYMVNIDSDGQFNPADITRVLEPLIQGKGQMATASRFLDPALTPKMSSSKLFGNRLMSILISKLTGRKFADVSCGFRAYTRDALLRLNLFGTFTYTQETFLDLSYKNVPIVEVPVAVRGNREFGESRIASNLFVYAYLTSKIIFRSFRDYKPMRVFASIGGVMLAVATVLTTFLMIHYLQTGAFTPHKWAAFTSAFLAGLGFLIMITGLIADMLTRIRINQERILYMLKKQNQLEPLAIEPEVVESDRA